jgi:phage/plasmid-like protein (TIGR03299 family)
VDQILAVEDGAHYESAGALHGGEVIWALARVPEEIRIKGTDDVTRPYLLFANYHKPGKAAIARLVSTRVVCWNTLSIALAETGAIFKIPHIPNVEGRINKARAAIFGIREQIKDMDAVMNTLAGVQVPPKVLREALIEILPAVTESAQAQNKARDILALFEDNDADAFPSQRGTAYALLNAVTRYTDHVASFRPAAGETDAEARKRAALFGAGHAFKFAALTGIVNVLSRNSLASFDSNAITAQF